MDDINTLRRILRENHVVAVVGLSADWFRPSYFVAKYLQEHGYRIIPVNPRYAGKNILGERCFAGLREISERVDVVDVFRKTADVPPVAEDAIAIGAKVVWMQEGIRNDDAARDGEAHGLRVVMDTCIRSAHRRMMREKQ